MEQLNLLRKLVDTYIYNALGFCHPLHTLSSSLRNESETIEQSKLEAGATIHMVLSLRGGAL